MFRTVEDIQSAKAQMLSPESGTELIDACYRACREFADFLIRQTQTIETTAAALEAMALAIDVGDVADIEITAFEVYLVAIAVRTKEYSLIEAAACELFSMSRGKSLDDVTLALLVSLARVIPDHVPHSEYFREYLVPLRTSPPARDRR